jgi:formate hydrogenlyase transcriptional activator
METLEAVGWVVGGAAGAAAKLGLKRTTLIHKMKKHGISRPTQEGKEETLDEEVPEDPFDCFSGP